MNALSRKWYPGQPGEIVFITPATIFSKVIGISILNLTNQAQRYHLSSTAMTDMKGNGGRGCIVSVTNDQKEKHKRKHTDGSLSESSTENKTRSHMVIGPLREGPFFCPSLPTIRRNPSKMLVFSVPYRSPCCSRSISLLGM